MNEAQNQTLLESIATIASNLGSKVRKITTHEYVTARSKRVKLRRQVYMSGAKLKESFLSEEEITLLNKIQPGLYNEQRWAVLGRSANGGDGSIDIVVPNKTQEDRIRLMGEAPTLATMLKRIIAEQEADEAPKSKRA